jgi:hypothetical protein
MLNLDSLLGLVIGGACTGLGSALGNYFAQRAFLRHLDKIK